MIYCLNFSALAKNSQLPKNCKTSEAEEVSLEYIATLCFLNRTYFRRMPNSTFSMLKAYIIFLEKALKHLNLAMYTA